MRRFPPAYFVLPHHLGDNPLRSRFYDSPLIPCILPSNHRTWLSDPLNRLFAAQYWTLTLRFIILRQTRQEDVWRGCRRFPMEEESNSANQKYLGAV
ncbi:MAG: hypothetical protein ACREX3_24990, partial [Gammaproteobacteria bacterium]